jgi:hypothetical protein
MASISMPIAPEVLWRHSIRVHTVLLRHVLKVNDLGADERF